MDNSSKQPLTATDKGHVRRLMIFLALVYLAEGLGQVSGLINQPLNYYLKTVFGWSPDRITEYLTVLTLPWVIKPVYGLISDFIPLFGYRRKTYLFLSNLIAVGAYLWMTQVTDSQQIIVALVLTAFGMAASSTLCGAVMVENGKKYSLSGTFVNQQWLWFYIASVGTSFAGGWLAQHLSPAHAFHTAALIVAFAPIGVMFGCWFLIAEEKAQINMQALGLSTKALFKTFKSRVLWVVGGFLFLYNFSPGFGTPLYFHMTDDLHFSQEFIGILGAIGSIGSIIGAFVYMWLQKRMTLKALLNLSILLGIISQGSYILLAGETSAIVLGIINGIFGMITLVASLTLAADYCPDGSEGFAYALLMSVNNLATQLSANVGAIMYVKVFHYHLNPLIIVSAATTALAFVLVPFLRLGNKMPGEKAKLD
jgi:MFS family permease